MRGVEDAAVAARSTVASRLYTVFQPTRGDARSRELPMRAGLDT